MLEVLAADEVKKGAYEILNIPLPHHGYRCLAITLRDGTSISGMPDTGSRPIWNEAKAEWDYTEMVPNVSVEADGVHLRVHILTTVTIPFEQIAGVYPFLIHWTESSSDSPARYIYPFGDDLLRIAEERGFPINHAWGNISAKRTVYPVFESLSFGYDTAMYCDWDAISRRQGGLNSLGVSVPWGGLSAGFSPSLWSAFHKVIKKRSVDLESICGGNDVVVRGFPQMVDLSDLPEKTQARWILNAEGADWMPIVIMADPRHHPTQNTWVFAYAKRDCAMLPTSCWEQITSPSRFFGEIVHQEFTTGWGPRSCYLKLRAVAHLARDEDS